LRTPIDIASKGGNYLLNVGPDSKGNVRSEEVERLHQIGKPHDGVDRPLMCVSIHPLAGA
jgi:alpha-L-fucosidase